MEALLLALRGLRWRRGVSLLVLALGVAVTAAAVGGPVYLRAGGESVLQDALREAPAAAVGIEVTQGLPARPDMLVPLRRAVEAAAAGTPGYGRTVAALEVDSAVVDERGGTLAATRLAYRDGVCARLRFVEGRCPQGVDEAVVSAGALDVLGDVLRRPVRVRGVTRGGEPVRLRVVGVYQPRDVRDDYWYGRGYFLATRDAIGDATTVDSLFTTEATFETLDPPVVRDRFVESGLLVRAVVDLPLDVRGITLDDEPALRSGAAAVEGRLRRTAPEALGFAYVGSVLDAAAEGRRGLTLPVSLAVAQLLLLGWCVLFTVVAGAASARAGEVALAKLRGFPPAATVAFGLLETVLVLVLAVPLGVLAALAGVTLLARAQLVDGVPVVLTPAALAGALVALAGGVAAAALAARRVLRSSVLELARRTPAPARRRGLLAVEVGAVLGAAACVADLVAHPGSPSDVRDARLSALLAPGLLAVAMSLLGTRALAAGCRRAFPRTRASRRLAAFLAVRQVARRPAGLRVVAVLATATGLATFAVVGSAVFAANREDRALAETGAWRVLTVDTGRGGSLLETVRAADPTGRYALAVASSDPVTTQHRLVGVDLDRWLDVAFWRPDLGPVDAFPRVRVGPQATGPLPGLYGRQAVPAGGGARRLAGLDSRLHEVDPVAVVDVVPGQGPGAVLVDLAALEARSDGRRPRLVEEVYLARDAPGSVQERLAAAGVEVLGDRRAADRVELYGRQAPALAMLLLLVGAGIAALLAAGGAVLDLALLARRRAFEVAALLAVGLRRRRVLSGVLLEQTLVLGTGATLGLLAGVAAARLTLPALPQFSDRPALPELVLAPPAPALGVLAAGAVLLVGAAGLAACVVLLRTAVPARLREAQA